jgi:hypothetical protein
VDGVQSLFRAAPDAGCGLLGGGGLPEQDDFLQSAGVVPLLKLQLAFEIGVARFEPGNVLLAEVEFRQRVMQLVTQFREGARVGDRSGVDQLDDLARRRQPGAVGSLDLGP